MRAKIVEEKYTSDATHHISKLTNPAEISWSRLDIDVWDVDTVGAGDFLGKVTLTGKALADLLNPSAEELEFPLNPGEDLSPREQTRHQGSLSLRVIF